ncbi:hypothetical protein ILUMI_20811 [Ignelater luminosus]|uniref:Uncharacterized protein n=1 Tax=Ignelater luminosus TaxID=2038154 RepID=A0A8K0G1Z2_IGNLU|nr:hypothetical protein ILUMI_20811 [Ignelater luminosus]
MRFVFWIDALLIAVAFILLQITDSSKNKIKNEEEYDEDEFLDNDIPLSEKIVFVLPKLFAAVSNSAIGFLRALLALFHKIFVENDVASFTNIGLLSEMFNTGHELQENFYDMVYIFKKEVEEE